jgi:hypothetical protein
MQKVIYSFIVGALVASLVWGAAYFRADGDSQELIEQVRSQRNSALARARKSEKQIEGIITKFGSFKAAFIAADERDRDGIKAVEVAADRIDSGIREYGRINNEFRVFIEENGTSE